MKLDLDYLGRSCLRQVGRDLLVNYHLHSNTEAVRNKSFSLFRSFFWECFIANNWKHIFHEEEYEYYDDLYNYRSPLKIPASIQEILESVTGYLDEENELHLSKSE